MLVFTNGAYLSESVDVVQFFSVSDRITKLHARSVSHRTVLRSMIEWLIGRKSTPPLIWKPCGFISDFIALPPFGYHHLYHDLASIGPGQVRLREKTLILLLRRYALMSVLSFHKFATKVGQAMSNLQVSEFSGLAIPATRQGKCLLLIPGILYRPMLRTDP